jgi:hypothetical protein
VYSESLNKSNSDAYIYFFSVLLFNGGMMTNDQVRRLNLLIAIKRAGNAAKLAGLSGTAPAYLSQLKKQSPDSKTGTPKMMGDDIARRIEAAIQESSGWMDTPHPEEWGAAASIKPTIVSSNIAPRPAAAEQKDSDDQDEVAGLIGIALTYRALSPESRKRLTEFAQSLMGQDAEARNNGHHATPPISTRKVAHEIK